MKAIVNVYLKEGVLDPQGKAAHHALESLGFKNVKDVRIGKQIVIDLNANSKEEALKEVEQMSETLLANTVIEDYNIEIVE
jgi:phosphoribosylformylglycinamidine synthase